jgi:hypothetical protein
MEKGEPVNTEHAGRQIWLVKVSGLMSVGATWTGYFIFTSLSFHPSSLPLSLPSLLVVKKRKTPYY